MNSNRLLLSISFFCTFSFCRSQDYHTDSIHDRIAHIRSMALDTAQIRLLRVLGYRLIEYDSLLSKNLIEEALEKSLIVKETNAITNCYRVLGAWHGYFNHKEKAVENYRLSRKSASVNNNLYLVAGADFNIGNIKYEKGEYDSCIHYYIRAAQIYEDPRVLYDKSVTERHLDMRKSDLYGNLSMIFNTLKNLQKADEFVDKAIAISKKYTSPAAADALAYYMQAKADNYYENGETERALRTRLEFLPQMEQGKGGRVFLRDAWLNVSREYFELEKIDSSRYFAEKGLQLAVELKAPPGIAAANRQLGRIAVYEKRYADAEKYLASAKGFYENTEDPVARSSYFNLMRELKFARGHYREAYLYFEKYRIVNDSLLRGEATKEFSEREARYQSEKKEATIRLQQAVIGQKNLQNYILMGGAAGLLVILTLLYRNYLHRQKLQRRRIVELETEKQLAATESVLKGEEQERGRLAQDLHDGLGGMLSGIKYSLNSMKGNLLMTPENSQAFERSMDMLDNSIKEMRRVAHNMMPEVLVRFGLDAALKDFCDDIDQSGALHINYQSIGLGGTTPDQTISLAIYRIVQELVNNVIKHAQATTVMVQLSKAGDEIVITVEDDGRGFDTSVVWQKKKGIGWENIRNRVDFLKGTLDLRSVPGEGTSVLIEFKL